jgi:hypothetical protein
MPKLELELPLIMLLLLLVPEPKLASMLIVKPFVAAAFELIVELLPEPITGPSTSSIAVVVTAFFASPCFAIAFATSRLMHFHFHLLYLEQGDHLE